jgi:hypothetical protein
LAYHRLGDGRLRRDWRIRLRLIERLARHPPLRDRHARGRRIVLRRRLGGGVHGAEDKVDAAEQENEKSNPSDATAEDQRQGIFNALIGPLADPTVVVVALFASGGDRSRGLNLAARPRGLWLYRVIVSARHRFLRRRGGDDESGRAMFTADLLALLRLGHLIRGSTFRADGLNGRCAQLPRIKAWALARQRLALLVHG